MDQVSNAIKAGLWGGAVELFIDFGVKTYLIYQDDQKSLGTKWSETVSKAKYDWAHRKSGIQGFGKMFLDSLGFDKSLFEKPIQEGGKAVGLGGVVEAILAVVPAAFAATLLDFEWILAGFVGGAALSVPIGGVFLPGIAGGTVAYGANYFLA